MSTPFNSTRLKRLFSMSFICFISIGFWRCAPVATVTNTSAKAVINITNSGKLDRHQEVFSISAAELKAAWPHITQVNFSLRNPANGKEIPYQWEYSGQEHPVNLLLQASVNAHSTLTLAIVKGKNTQTAPKTFARFVPERLDDFAWENDRIAFRMYGPALEGSANDAHGIDVWTKRTSELIINKWYKNGDYHTDHGEGMDYYGVGKSLGAGDIAPFIDHKLYYSKNYATYQLLDNGPLRSTFVLNYAPWKAGNLTVSVRKKISLDTNTQLNKVEITYQISGAKHLPTAIGIVLRPQQGVHLMDRQNGILGYWEPQHGEDGTTGVGVIVPDHLKKLLKTPKHLLAKITGTDQTPLVYYNGAVWDKAGLISSSQEWFRYLQDFNYKLKHPVSIEVN